MKTYTATFEAVTNEAIQSYLYDLWRAEQANPQEICIAEADFERLAASLVPAYAPSDFARELLGEAHYEQEVARVSEQRRRLDGVINWTTGRPMKLIRAATRAPGTVIFREERESGLQFEAAMKQLEAMAGESAAYLETITQGIAELAKEVDGDSTQQHTSPSR